MIEQAGKLRPGRYGWVSVLIVGLVVVLAACTGGGGPLGGSGAGSESAEPEPATITLLPADDSEDVRPDTPILITVVHGSVDEVSVTDDAGVEIPGVLGSAESGAAGPLWRPETPLAYGRSYTVSATATGDDGAQVSAETSFDTVTPTALVFPSIGPLDGTTVGVGMPIRVYFDQPVTNKAEVERNLIVTPSVAVEGSWSWFSDTEIHWRPMEYWPANITVEVQANLYGLDVGGGVYGEVDRVIAFTIGERHVSVADAATHTMQVYQNDVLVQTFPISMGRPDFPSRTGPHVVSDLTRFKTMDSTTYGLALDAGGYVTQVEYAVRINNNGEFVHAAPWSVAQQGNSNVSHGCINLSVEAAAWFFGFTLPGDVVENINTGAPLTAADGDIYDWIIPWEQWIAGSALR